MAKKLVDVAVESGVDVVKFQVYKTENIVTEEAKQAQSQGKSVGDKLKDQK